MGIDPKAHDRRDRASLERAMVDASEQEARELLVGVREQIREILVQAQRDLTVLRGQIQTAHEHVRGPGPYTRHLVRDIAGSVRPEIRALDHEAAALQHALRQYREEMAQAPLASVAPAAAPPEAPAPEPPGTHAAPRSRLVIATAFVLAAATAIGIAALQWSTHQPVAGPAVAPHAPHLWTLWTPQPVQPAQPPPNTDAGVHVVLEARQPVWVRVRTDGTTDSGRILDAGSRREISGSRISVRAGNAGALTVSVGNGPFEVFGRNGQPLTRDFGVVPSLPPERRIATPPAPVASAPAPPVPTAAPDLPAATPPAPIARVPPSVPPAGAAPPTTTAADVEVVRAAEAWLMAFFNHDPAAMAKSGGSGTIVDDQRTTTDRPPAGVTVRRSLEDVKVQVVNGSALYTARLVESTPGGMPYISLISQVWIRVGSTWQMLSARVMPEARVRSALH